MWSFYLTARKGKNMKKIKAVVAISLRILVLVAIVGVVLLIGWFAISKLKKDTAGSRVTIEAAGRESAEVEEGEALPEILPPSNLEITAEQLPEILPPPIETTAEEETTEAAVHEDGWNKEDGVWYYYRDNNRLTDEWVEENGGLYYLMSDGSMATGWVKSGEAEYCFYQSGSQIGQLIINDWGEKRADNSFSYMGEDGRPVKDTVIDGYTIGADGRWVQ